MPLEWNDCQMSLLIITVLRRHDHFTGMQTAFKHKWLKQKYMVKSLTATSDVEKFQTTYFLTTFIISTKKSQRTLLSILMQPRENCPVPLVYRKKPGGFLLVQCLPLPWAWYLSLHDCSFHVDARWPSHSTLCCSYSGVSYSIDWSCWWGFLGKYRGRSHDVDY